MESELDGPGHVVHVATFARLVAVAQLLRLRRSPEWLRVPRFGVLVRVGEVRPVAAGLRHTTDAQTAPPTVPLSQSANGDGSREGGRTAEQERTTTMVLPAPAGLSLRVSSTDTV